jgi:hypothetical protein
VLAHSLGVAAPNPGFSAAQAGARISKAALLFTVHSAGADVINAGDMPVLSTLATSAVSLAKRVDSAASAAVASPLALLNTAVRGVAPSHHGVTACSWAASPLDGDVTRALTAAPASAPLVASVADRVAQSFAGKPLLVAVGASEPVANSLGLHPELAGDAELTANWNAATLVADTTAGEARYTDYSSRKFSAQSNAYAARVLPQAAAKAMADPVAALSSPLATLTRDPSGESQLVSVKFVGVGSIPQLDLADALQAALLRELAAAKATVSAALTHEAFAALRADDAPDMFSVGVSGLKAIAARDGADSELYRTCARLVDALFGQLRQDAVAAYGDAITVSALLLGSPRPSAGFTIEQQAAVTAAVAAALPRQPVNVAAFPALYAAPAALAVDGACAAVSAAVAAAMPSARAHCVLPAAAAVESVAGLRRRLVAAGATASSAADGAFLEIEATVSASVRKLEPTVAKATEKVTHYQIVLWTVVGLVVVTFAALYSTCMMDFKKDAQLWAGLNPAWSKSGPRR